MPRSAFARRLQEHRLGPGCGHPSGPDDEGAKRSARGRRGSCGHAPEEDSDDSSTTFGGAGSRRPDASFCVNDMKEQLLTAEGRLAKGTKEGTVPPIVSHYFRVRLQPSMSIPLARKSQHLAAIIDLALRGRVAAALDIAGQRLKPLESMARGNTGRCRATARTHRPRKAEPRTSAGSRRSREGI